MSKLMTVLGILLLAVGAALAVTGYLNPAQMQIQGLSLDTAATLLTGGILAIGLGGVIGALQGYAPAVAAPVQIETVEEPLITTVVPPVVTSEPAPASTVPPVLAAEQSPARIRFPGFGRKTAEVAATTAVVAAVTETAAPAKSAVDDTIAALEQAKADIANAIGGVSDIAEAKVEDAEELAEEVVEDDEPAAEEDVDDGELYVLEEREIRGRPARILSDQTVEAETDEGWMRFENLEHLNEYLDAMGETA
jgi:hypothetical protein